MDSNKLTKVVFGVGAFILLAGIVYYFKRGLEAFTKIDFYVTKVRLAKISLTEAKVDAEIKLMNPSDLGFTVKGYDIDFGINGRFIAKLKGSGLAININPRADIDIPLTATFDPRLLGVQLGLILLDVYSSPDKSQYKNDLQFRYKGTLSGAFGGLNLNEIPIDYTYKMNE